MIAPNIFVFLLIFTFCSVKMKIPKEGIVLTREDIARTIKESRLATGLTQNQVAKELDRPQQTIANWESGKSQPDASTLFDLFRILNRSVDEAFGLTKETPPLSSEALMIARRFERLKPWGRKMVWAELEKQTAQQSSLAQNLKKYRKHKRLTQKELAEITSIPLSLIKEFESEHNFSGHFISEGQLALIATVLEIPPELLLGRSVTYENMCNMMDQNFRQRLDEILEQLNSDGQKKATELVKKLGQNPGYLANQELSTDSMEVSSSLDSAYARLNLYGRQKAVDGVEALVKNSKYRSQDFPVQQKGTDTHLPQEDDDA